jgi:hypothetical protein
MTEKVSGRALRSPNHKENPIDPMTFSVALDHLALNSADAGNGKSRISAVEMRRDGVFWFHAIMARLHGKALRK